MPRVLLIAFHFPPLRSSSGLQRTLKLAQYLPEFGWTPAVLTIDPRAYWITSTDQMSEIREGMLVKRSFGVDSKDHLSIGGKYFNVTAIPDRWISWFPFAMFDGWRMIRDFKPDLIWSTYPIATAQLIGLNLHKLSGIPWIVDSRDPIDYRYGNPAELKARVYRYIERSVVKYASRLVCTTPGTARFYADKYGSLAEEKCRIISNGYDEENFHRAEEKPSRREWPASTRILVHSGLISSFERDPLPFFKALSRLKREGFVTSGSLKVIFRATENDGVYRQPLHDLDVDDIVELAPAIGYEDALREILDADGLLLFQGAKCNQQIPAKAYEYLRARRPILGLLDRQGDTAALLQDAGIDSMADIANPEDIYVRLRGFLEAIAEGTAPTASEEAISRYSRLGMAESFAELFDEVLGEQAEKALLRVR
jgi:glycosyltransferase involved in cell wall biosynthesis